MLTAAFALALGSCGPTPSGTSSPTSQATDHAARTAAVDDPAAARARLEAAIKSESLDPTLPQAIYDVVRLADRGAAPMLLELLERVGHRSDFSSLAIAVGVLGDERSADALLRARLLDLDTTRSRSVAAHAGLALASLGTHATQSTIRMMRGDGDWPAFSEAHGLDQDYLFRIAAQVLGDLGDPAAVPALVDGALPCEGPGSEFWGPRCATAFEALGRIGDPAATTPLCEYIRDHLEGEGAPQAVAALGEIGGPEATRCLIPIIEGGSWDSARSSGDAQRAALAAALNACDASNLAAVRTASEKTVRTRGTRSKSLAMLELCKDDVECLRAALEGEQFPWQLRLVAAHHLVRVARGDLGVAQTVSETFRQQLDEGVEAGDDLGAAEFVRLVPRIADGKPCSGCVADIQAGLDGTLHLNLSWMGVANRNARVAIALVGEPGRNYDRSLIPEPGPIEPGRLYFERGGHSE